MDTTVQTHPIKTKKEKKTPKRRNKSLKLNRLLKEIQDPNNETLMDAGIKAGYSKKSTEIYRPRIKQQLSTYLDPNNITIDSLRFQLANIHQLCIDKDDPTNALRAIESIVRMLGGYKDKQETTHRIEKTPQEEQELDALRTALVAPTINDLSIVHTNDKTVIEDIS